jgi:hypothetical protein
MWWRYPANRANVTTPAVNLLMNENLTQHARRKRAIDGHHRSTVCRSDQAERLRRTDQETVYVQPQTAKLQWP